jgi:hypothetical protein
MFLNWIQIFTRPRVHVQTIQNKIPCEASFFTRYQDWAEKVCISCILLQQSLGEHPSVLSIHCLQSSNKAVRDTATALHVQHPLCGPTHILTRRQSPGTNIKESWKECTKSLQNWHSYNFIDHQRLPHLAADCLFVSTVEDKSSWIRKL